MTRERAIEVIRAEYNANRISPSSMRKPISIILEQEPTEHLPLYEYEVGYSQGYKDGQEQKSGKWIDSSNETGIKLDEAIERYASNAEFERAHGNLQGCLEFRQVAKWLRELKMYRHYLLKTGVEPQEGSEKE